MADIDGIDAILKNELRYARAIAIVDLRPHGHAAIDVGDRRVELVVYDIIRDPDRTETRWAVYADGEVLASGVVKMERKDVASLWRKPSRKQEAT